MKKILSLVQLLPAVAVGLAAAIGFQLSAPALEAIVWPEEPDLSAVAEDAETLDEEETEAVAEELLAQGVGDFEDGVYYGSGTGFSGITQVEVVVENRQIVQITVLSYQDDDSFFNRARAVIDSVLTAQTWEVDTVSGATYSSTGIREAVKAALKKAAGQSVSALSAEDDEDDQTETSTNTVTSQDVTLPEGAPADGSYTGTGECAKFGYSVTLTAVFRNGVLTALKDFALLDNDDEDNEPFAASAWAGMKSNLLSGSTDVVSGATYSSNAILAAYQDAYAQAVAAGGGTVETPDINSDESQSGDADEEQDEEQGETENDSGTQDEEQSAEVLPADGTYTASALCEPDEYEDFEAYTLTADVTFADGMLVSIDNLTSTDDSNLKYYTRAAEGTSKYTGVVAQLIEQQSSADIDVVTNATCSSVALVAIYEDAYAQAVAAQTEGEGDSDTGETQDEDSGSSELTGTPADGTYTASALCEPDEYEDFEAYTLTADVTFEGGKLVSIDNLTSTDDSNLKYYTRAAEGTSKYTGVVAQLIDKQSSADIDAVSNATCSSVALVAIYENAYAQAVAAAQTEDEGDSDTGETPDEDSGNSELTGTPADGTYTASALCEPDEYEDFEAYTLTADVTFTDGKLVSIDNLTSTDDSNLKYYTRAANGTSKYTGVVAQLIEQQSSGDIDAVSNATCSSVALVAIYEDAYAQAVAANEQITAAAVETDEDTEAEEAEPEETVAEESTEAVSAAETVKETAAVENATAEAEYIDESTEEPETEQAASTAPEAEEPAAEEQQTAEDEAAAEETSPQSEKEDAEE